MTSTTWELGRLPGERDIYTPSEEGKEDIRKSMCKGPESRRSMFHLGTWKLSSMDEERGLWLEEQAGSDPVELRMYLKVCGRSLNKAAWGVPWSDLHFSNVCLAAEWGTIREEGEAKKLDAMAQVRGCGTLDRVVGVGIGQMLRLLFRASDQDILDALAQ